MIRRPRVVLSAVSLLALLVIVASCSSSAPPAQPTAAPAKPAAAEPTKAAAPAAPAPTSAAPAAAAPTSAPAVQPATDWPKQPITLIVPWAAGGDTDVPMRVVAEFVGKELGQPVVVQNVVGGSGSTGVRQARGAKPDGYTLLSIHDHISINQGTGLIDFGWEAFDPIAFIVSSPEFELTEASQPWNSLKDVIEDAKKRPGQITAGVTFGSTAQMHVWMIMYKTGVKFKPVGYDGTAQRITALLGKQIDLGASPLSSALEQYKAKKVKVLGYANPTRDPLLPDVPTYREQGVDMDWGTNRGWVAPKGTPPAVIARIEAAIKKVTEDPAFKQKIEGEMGSKVQFMDHVKYAEYLAKSDVDLKKVIKETGMTTTQ